MTSTWELAKGPDAMAVKKPPPSANKKPTSTKKQKQPTQRTPLQRVMVVGGTGKRRFEWRPW